MPQVRQNVYVAGFRDRPPSLAAVRALIDWLSDGIDRAIRLRLEGRSSAVGPRPRWAAVSREIGVERLEPGSIDLSLTMPTVGDLLGAAPVWQQPGLFLAQPRPEQSPLDVFGEALRDAVEERDDAATLDAPLLEHIASARALFELGAEQIDLPPLDAGAPSARVVVRADGIERVSRMAARAPVARRVRLVGILHTLSVEGGFLLDVGQEQVRGLLLRQAGSAVAPLLGERVLAEGELVYRPSGRPLRLDASVLRRAEAADERWARWPAAARAKPRAEGPPSGGFDDLFEGAPDDGDDELRDLEESTS